MGHNSVVSGHLKSIGIPWVDMLSTGPPNLWCHIPSDKVAYWPLHSSAH